MKLFVLLVHAYTRGLSDAVGKTATPHGKPVMCKIKGVKTWGTFLMFLEILPSEEAHRKPLWRVFPKCLWMPLGDAWCVSELCKVRATPSQYQCP